MELTYSMSIKETIEKYKQDLKRLKKFEIIHYAIIAAAVIIWCITFFAANFNSDYNAVRLGNILVVVALIDAFAVNMAYIKPQKKKIIENGHITITEAIIKEYFPKCKYSLKNNPEIGMTTSEICATGLIKKGANAFDITNNINSIYKGVPFKFSAVDSYNYDQINVRNIRHFRRISREIDIKETSFKGCWFIFNCRIQLSSSITVISKISKFTSELIYKQSVSAIRQINTPNQEFNDNFLVFAYDIESPQALLTDSLMKKIILLQKRTSAPLRIYFDNGIVHVGIEVQKNFFAPMLSIFDSVETMTQSAQDDADFILKCLSIFDLSDYVTKAYTDFKTENDSIFYTGKDVDTVYYI